METIVKTVHQIRSLFNWLWSIFDCRNYVNLK